MRKISYVLMLATMLLSVVDSEAKHPFNHGLWDKVVKKWVSEDGKVDYNGIRRDLNFKMYTQIMSKTPPGDHWTKEEKLTYWINAYNAFTVKLIITNPKIKSIKDIGNAVEGPWDRKFIVIGNKRYSLGEIEHEIIRKQFDEPRIHFALVCAANSCPNLRKEAYFVDKLDAQLDDQAKTFINKLSKNQITANRVKLSKIFLWYKDDFTKDQSLFEFINRYSNVHISKKAKISYLEYDWALNSWVY